MSIDWNNENEVEAMVKENGVYLKDASQRLQNNEEIALLALEKCEANDFEYIMEHVIGESLKNSKEFIRKAINIWGVAINYVGDELNKDEEFMRQYRLEIVSKDPYMVSRLSDISDDIELAKQVIMEDGELIKFFSDKIKGNTEIASMLLKKFPESIMYFPEYLYEDKEFLSNCNLDDETLQEIVEIIKFKKENSIGGAILGQDFWGNEVYMVTEQKEVKTFAKQAYYRPDGSISLCSTIYEGEKTSVGDACYKYYADDQGIMVLVYSGDLSVEENLELLSRYNGINAMGFENFLEYHESDLKKCIGIDNYYNYIISFKDVYSKSRKDTIKEIIENIERNIADGEYNYEEELEYLKSELEKVQEYTSDQIVEGIEPTESGMEEVIEETVSKQGEKTALNKDDRPGEEQGDN